MTGAAPAFGRPRPRTAGVRDVVYTFSNVTWQGAYRRGFFMPEDRLVRSLLASDRVGRLLVCNHARSLPRKLARSLTGSDRAPFPSDHRTHLIEPLRLARQDPATPRAVARGFAAYQDTIARAVRRHGLQDPVVITGHPLVAGFCKLPWAGSVTWYAIDDWAEHPAYRRWWGAYRESYSRVAASGRRVAAVSSTLLRRLAPTGPGIVVSNGVDPDEWTGEPEPPNWVAELSRPLLVYVGALDSRIAVEWLRAVATALPEAAVALVGPLVEPEWLAPVASLPNVHVHPPVGRRALAGLIRNADVGLLPHVSSRLTEAMSPLKLLEYLAAGLPVAATDLSPVRALDSPRVVTASQDGDYVETVRRALAMGRASEEERLRFIEANSWRERHELVLDLAFG